MQFRLFSIAVSIILLTIISCDRKGLDYDKIDFEVRKRSINFGFENPRLERKSETNRPLYLFYEDEISNYKKELSSFYNRLDSLREHKDIWLDTLRFRQAQQIKDNEDFADLDMATEREYDILVQDRIQMINILNKNLESENKLYEDVSKNSIYYEFIYEISGIYSWDDKGEIVVEARVRVDEESNVFECLFLDNHLYDN